MACETSTQNVFLYRNQSSRTLLQADAHRARLLGLRHFLETCDGQVSRAKTTAGSHKKAGSDDGLPTWSTGVADIDAALPQGGLSQDGVHEFAGTFYADTVAASGYLFALLKRLADVSCQASRCSVLFCQTANVLHEFGDIYGAGLNAFGLEPHRFIFARAAKNNDVLFAVEEGARAASLLAVVAEVDSLSFTQSRRLKLAAAAGGTPVLILRRHDDCTSSAADTRWRLTAAPGNCDPLDGRAPGHPHWHVALTRCRGGRTGGFVVEWNHETHCIGLVQQVPAQSAALADRQSEQSIAHGVQRFSVCR